MLSRTRCSIWPPGGIDALLTIGAATAVRASPGTATTWTPTLTTSQRSSKSSTSRTSVHVGHSTGGGEVARYIGRHGTARVAKAVLIGAIPPVMVKSAANPGGTPLEEFDKLRAAVLADRAQFWKDLSLPFYSYNRPGAKISEGVRESFFLQSMMTGFPGSYFCIKAFSQEVRCSNADHSRRRRPDRANRRLCPALVQDCEGGQAEGLQGRTARIVHNPQKPGERGLARFHQRLRRGILDLSPTSRRPFGHVTGARAARQRERHHAFQSQSRPRLCSPRPRRSCRSADSAV